MTDTVQVLHACRHDDQLRANQRNNDIQYALDAKERSVLKSLKKFEEGLRRQMVQEFTILRMSQFEGALQTANNALATVAQMKVATMDPIAARNVSARIKPPPRGPIPDGLNLNPESFSTARREGAVQDEPPIPSVLTAPTNIVSPDEMDRIFNDLANQAMQIPPSNEVST